MSDHETKEAAVNHDEPYLHYYIADSSLVPCYSCKPGSVHLDRPPVQNRGFPVLSIELQVCCAVKTQTTCRSHFGGSMESY